MVRDWALQLGCRVLVNDPPREEAGLPGEYTPLDELLSESDAVTLHTPLTRSGDHPTYHLIGEREIGLIRAGKTLVNAARGPVVDFAALRRHLDEGRIRAIIDTWEGEPVIDPDVLDKVVYGTFHIAGYSRQGKERATRMALEAVSDVLGIDADLSGLEPVYAGTPGLSAERIVGSYDPATDTEALKAAPDSFDKLRHDYNYREEVG